MKRIKVRLRQVVDTSYEIVIDSGIFSRIPRELKKMELGNRYLVVTDSNLEKKYGRPCIRHFAEEGLKADLVSFEAGEGSKSIRTFEKLIGRAHDLGLDRGSAIVALGGGVVGDVAGFVAATYMRGIPYIQIPTTLLAMVDSSIGGKVAVDILSGKNMCGAFYQPRIVYIDVSLLKGLSKQHLQNGLSEVVKHAFIKDKGLVSFIDRHLSAVMGLDPKILSELVARSCFIKAKVVEKDEKESGIRQIVNYGHTVGHALETATGYKKFFHGQAIAIGMAVAARISRSMGLLSKEEERLHNGLLKKIGLPITLPDVPIGRLKSLMAKDKKAIQGKIKFVLLEHLGKARYGVSVPDALIKQALTESKIPRL